MLTKLQFRTLMIIAVLVLILAAVDVALLMVNRSLQQTLNERQVYIQQTLQSEYLYREMAKALGELALRNDDKEIKSLLQSQGFTLTPPAAAAGKGGATQ